MQKGQRFFIKVLLDGYFNNPGFVSGNLVS
jgi:hypothetical protein